MISSNFLSLSFIFPGTFEYKIVAWLRFKLRNNNQNLGSRLPYERLSNTCPPPKKNCHSEKMKLTYSSLYKESQNTRHSIYFEQQNTVTEGSQYYNTWRKITPRQEKWNSLKKRDKRKGSEPQISFSYFAESVRSGRINLMV